MIFWKNFDKSFHIVSKNLTVHKGLRIFVFFNEAILNFFHLLATAVALWKKFCSNFILMYFWKSMWNLSTFPNQDFDSKSVNPLPRYPTFSATTLAKSTFPGKIEEFNNLKYRQFWKPESWQSLKTNLRKFCEG